MNKKDIHLLAVQYERMSSESQSVVDLIEMLKSKHPELEDEINQILEATFDVIDALDHFEVIEGREEEANEQIDNIKGLLIQSDY